MCIDKYFPVNIRTVLRTYKICIKEGCQSLIWDLKFCWRQKDDGSKQVRIFHLKIYYYNMAYKKKRGGRQKKIYSQGLEIHFLKTTRRWVRFREDDNSRSNGVF